MALYTRDSIERLRDTVDMADLVGSKTDLRRVGTRLTGLCPFHDERTPSFSVNVQDKLFYCFGCHAKGDAIGFVEQTEGLDFRESVEFLADRYGVELQLENEDPQAEARRRRRERLLALLDRAARFYDSYLWESTEAARARDYLAGRGFSEEILRRFRVGYSPSAWDRMLLGARQSGFTEEELMAAGLAQRGRDGRSAYDRFRARIMFPLADGRGRVLGFGARQMGEGRGPKYLNTSENELYHKGRQLFGLDIARAEAARSGRIVVVEGYTDVLALHQAGIGEAVAIMGTALTQEQLAEVGRAASTLVLALDADRSGQEAMLRASRLAEERGLELRVVEMPEGTDPAELVISAGAEGFVGRMERAVPMIEFQVRRVLADADLNTPSGRDKALGEARKLISAVPERTATRDALVREAADRLDVPVDYVLAAPAPVRPQPVHSGGDPGPEPPPPAAPASGFSDASVAAERAYLSMCLASGALGREYLERLSEEHLSSPALRSAREHLVASFDDPLAGLGEDDPATAAVVTGVAMAAQEQGEATEPALRMSFLQLDLRRIEREMRRADDNTRRMELAGARQQVRRDMDQIMGQTA
jgi:DNA primase